MLEDDSKSNHIKIINEKFLIKLAFFCFVGIILAISTMVFLGRNSTVAKCSSNSIALGQSSIGGDFTLTDIYGKQINSIDFITEPSLIYFGYSYCPDVCPFDLYRNSLVVDILKELDINITPIFITIDPTRDTPKQLASFSSFIHPKLIALTGSEIEIKNVMKLFKVYGKKPSNPGLDKTAYLMDHSAFTYLVSSSNEFINYFNRKISAEEMAGQVSCLLGKN